jgi:tetratricopeptide (TPR) repeat protein
MSDKKPVIFISYSHKDSVELEYVRSHLGPIASLGSMTVWSDEELQIGDDWKGDINSAIDACTVFILLVSRHSLSSKFILEVELPRVFPRWQSKQIRFCPILVTPCHMDGLWWLDALNRRPKNGEALSELDESARDREMTTIVGDIAKLAGPSMGHSDGGANPFDASPPSSGHPTAPDIVDYGHLPETPYKTLVGREVELTALHEVWIDKLTNIVSLVAWGGAGKTALLNEWLLQMRGDNYRGAAAVLGWSFYSQGTKERATSAEGFFDWALEKLGVVVPTNSATVKAEKLAEAMGCRRVLLVLDGMEPLQHGPDGQEGYLKDQGMRTFLRRFAGMPPVNANGLVVITSRLEIRDIEALKGSKERPGSHRNMALHRLSDEAGAALLKDNGVVGSENERRTAAHEFDGHALALSLLASYLTELHGGDVRRRDHVRALLRDSKNPGHGHAWRVMQSYEKEWLHLNPMLRIVAKTFGPKYFPKSFDKLLLRSMLSIVGLFDRPASVACLEALRGRPAIHGLTDVVVGVDDDEWNRAVARLRKTRLLDPEDPNSPGVLDAHPLVREWFGDHLKRTNEAGWKAAHGRLYEHLRDTTIEGSEPTLPSLTPLYQAIAHGCRADRHQECLGEVYKERICRRLSNGDIEFYATRKLGANGSDLAAISWFFIKPYEAPVAALKAADGAWLLGLAAIRLRAQGRLVEALPVLRASLRIFEISENWRNAAIGASNLSEFELLVGEVDAAISTAEQSVVYGDRSGDGFLSVVNRVTHASAALAAGRRDEAEKLFADAEQLQEKRQPEFPLLYSVQGYLYRELLMDKGKWADALSRATQTLEWGKQGYPILSRALDVLTLGRSDLGLVLKCAERRIEDAVWERIRAVRSQLDDAVESIHSAGQSHYIPISLLARAAFRRSVGDWEGASRDLDEVEEIAEPGRMKLSLCDMALERARLAFAKIEGLAPLHGLVDDNPLKPIAPDAAETARLKDQATKQLVIAADYIKSCGYHRRDEELAELEAVLHDEKKFADLPPKV